MAVKTILLLSANPKGTAPLRLDEEVKLIKDGLKKAKNRKLFRIEQEEAVTARDVQRAMLEHEPHIVHFSGHGEGEPGIILEGSNGTPQTVSGDALADLFELFADQVECVVLNACYSEHQAQGIAQHVPSVVGMNQAIGDIAAIEYAVSFYDALGAGRPVEFAHKLGCNAIKLMGIKGDLTPVLVEGQKRPPKQKHIFISYKRDVAIDGEIAGQIYEALQSHYSVFIDRTMAVGTQWMKRIDAEIQRADVLIVLLSDVAVQSEMVMLDIEKAHRLWQQTGRPLILPVRLAYHAPFQYPLSEYLNPINWAFWQDKADTASLISELQRGIEGQPLSLDTDAAKERVVMEPDAIELLPPAPVAQPSKLEKPEGTMTPRSEFYVERSEDGVALEAIAEEGVTLTIKGARQMGKSSLLMRVIEAGIQAGKQAVFLDFQMFDRDTLHRADDFFYQFCLWLTDALEFEDDKLDAYWQRPQGNRQRCTRYVQRHILPQLDSSLVLAMDEVESIFDTPFRTDFFGMLRSWHNQRATSRLWRKLDLALVTSTEPYQLIDDLNQSPFNVGEVLDLPDFSLAQVHDLNQRHGMPLTEAEEQQLMALVNGHPYLVRRALYLVARQRMTARALFAQATDERGPFGDHLRYHLFRMYDKPELVEGLLQVIRQQGCANEHIFFRLRGAGLIRRGLAGVVPRCSLYAHYFQEHLNG